MSNSFDSQLHTIWLDFYFQNSIGSDRAPQWASFAPWAACLTPLVSHSFLTRWRVHGQMNHCYNRPEQHRHFFTDGSSCWLPKASNHFLFFALCLEPHSATTVNLRQKLLHLFPIERRSFAQHSTSLCRRMTAFAVFGFPVFLLPSYFLHYSHGVAVTAGSVTAFYAVSNGIWLLAWHLEHFCSPSFA